MPTAAASSTAGCLQQRLVDLARRDVLAALDDQLLQPAGDEVEAVGVAVAEVAGARASRPARSVAARRRRRVVDSRASRCRRATRFRRARRRPARVAVGRRRRAPPRRAAARRCRSLRCAAIERIGERDRRAFGQSHRLDHRNAEARLERAMLLGRQRRRRRAREAHARDTHPLARGVELAGRSSR